MKTKCPKCGWKWEYNGKSQYYITCPQCMRKFDIDKKKLKKEVRK
jgi:ribosomal protein S27E